MATNLQFRRGLKGAYDNLTTKDSNDIYIIEQSVDGKRMHSMYLGENPIGDVVTDNITITSDIGSYKTNDKITAGTTITDILTKLLCKEMNPTYTAPKAKISYTDPKFGSLRFVGETLSIPKFTLAETSGTFNSDWTQPAEPSYTTSNKQMKIGIVNGFENYTFAQEYTDADSIPSQDVTVELGNNKIIAYGKYDYTKPSNYPVTNLGNTYESVWEDGTTSAATATIELTGVYKMYSNAATYVDNKGVFTETNKDDVEHMTDVIHNNVTVTSTFDLYLGFSKYEYDKTSQTTNTPRIFYLPPGVKIVSQKGYSTSDKDYTLTSFFVPTAVETKDGFEDYVRYEYVSDMTIGQNTFKISCEVPNSVAWSEVLNSIKQQIANNGPAIQ